MNISINHGKSMVEVNDQDYIRLGKEYPLMTYIWSLRFIKGLSFKRVQDIVNLPLDDIGFACRFIWEELYWTFQTEEMRAELPEYHEVIVNNRALITEMAMSKQQSYLKGD